MNAFLNPRNGTSLTNSTDVTVHSISVYQEGEPPKDINEIDIPQTGIAISEPIGVQIDESGNNNVRMYQFIGSVNDGKTLD